MPEKVAAHLHMGLTGDLESSPKSPGRFRLPFTGGRKGPKSAGDIPSANYNDQEEVVGPKPGVFPPRKRSIPYGFDFDLDEVWAPLHPHLRGVYNKGDLAGSTSASSSDNSIHGGRLPHDEQRAPTARLSGRGRSQDDENSQDSQEFAVENEDIFQQINSLALSDGPLNALEASSASTSFSSIGLPSARTLRGGVAPVARGRHGSHGGSADSSVPPSATPSTFSERSYHSYTSSSSLSTARSRIYGGASSPASSRRINAGLTPGLAEEQRRSQQQQQQQNKKMGPGTRSNSLSPTAKGSNY